MYFVFFLGYIIVFIVGGCWFDYIMKCEVFCVGCFDDCVNFFKLIYFFEDCMGENMWFVVFLYLFFFIVYGFIVSLGFKYIVVLVIVIFFFGVGSMLVFGVVMIMLIEFMF